MIPMSYIKFSSTPVMEYTIATMRPNNNNNNNNNNNTSAIT